jgi:hypothetical protein
MHMKHVVWSWVIVGALGLVACGDGGRSVAESAMKTVREQYDSVKADAAKYVPDQAKAIDEGLAGVQQAFEKGEYTQALTEAQGLTPTVGELGSAIAAKKAELTKRWEGLAADLPGVVEGLQKRVAELSKTRRLPRGVTREAVDAAKEGVKMLSGTWDEAVAAFKSANLTDAMEKGQMVKDKAAELLASLGEKKPDALK